MNDIKALKASLLRRLSLKSSNSDRSNDSPYNNRSNDSPYEVMNKVHNHDFYDAAIMRDILNSIRIKGEIDPCMIGPSTIREITDRAREKICYKLMSRGLFIEF